MFVEKDIGLILRLNTGVDISAATVANILYKKPSGTTGSFTGSTSDTYYVSYTTTSEDIDESGEWKFQAYVETSSYTVRGQISKVRVIEALDD